MHAQPAQLPAGQAPSGPPAGETQQPAAPAGEAPAPPSIFGGSTMLIFLLPLLLVFLMSRSQTKKQRTLEANLKVGDRVITQSGLIGKIVEMGERRTKIEIAPGVNVQMLKSAIQGQDGGETPATDKDKAEKAADKSDKADKPKDSLVFKAKSQEKSQEKKA